MYRCIVAYFPTPSHCKAFLPFFELSFLYGFIKAILVRLVMLVSGMILECWAFGSPLEVLSAGFADDRLSSGVLKLSFSQYEDFQTC